MENIRKIFFRDLIALLKNPFALLVAGGLCVLPALYAWFNIYSNWDPYANTAGIRIAVASYDRGYKDEDGKKTDMSYIITENLKKNKAISWTQVADPKEAKQGVYAGKYYAAVVFSKDFTKCMMEGFLEDFKRPKVTYYENEKKNAVAAKITDTAVSTLQNSINEQYIQTVVSRLFEKEGEIAAEVQSEKILKKLTKKTDAAQKTIEELKVSVRSLEQANTRLSASMLDANTDLGALRGALQGVSSKAADVPDTQALADRLNQKNSHAMERISRALSAMQDAAAADVQEKKEKYYAAADTALLQTKTDVDDLVNALNTININTINSSRKVTISQLESLSSSLVRLSSRLEKAMNTDPENEEKTGGRLSSEAERVIKEEISLLQQTLQGTVTRSLALVGSDLSRASEDIQTVSQDLEHDIQILSIVLGSGAKAIDLGNDGLAGIEADLAEMEVKLSQAGSLLLHMDEEQLLSSFSSFLQGDPKGYGAFFAQPISIKTEAVYPVENYGSGVTPFYTTLAIWVGGVVLVSLIKVKADADGLKNPRSYQLFFGRYLLFLLLSMVQTVIIVWGNLSIFHVQCLYPRRFLAAALLAGLTFSLLIYAFTLSFGDIGKAMIVVIMVLQVAGSSGTYPIEILPSFYQKVYIFFPFPYAINAMREAICGMYERDYALYLVELLIFAAAALVLGLFIRKPFMKINHFVEKRMEDTEMM